MMLIPHEQLMLLVKKALVKNGCTEEVGKNVSEALVWTNLRGIDSHGIRLLPHYMSSIKRGRINPRPHVKITKTSDCISLLSADDGFGHHAGVIAMNHCKESAAKFGVGIASVSNSSHCGAMSFYAHKVVPEGFISIAMTHATARIKTPNAATPFFGNNPIAVVAPMLNESPYCFDSATSKITFNELKRLAEEGRYVGNEMAADINGEMTNDPKNATQLIPIGNYKGFGISMCVDIFCGILSNLPTGDLVSSMFDDSDLRPRKLGQFYLAIDIEKFIPNDLFTRNMQDLVDRVRSLHPSHAGKDVMAPGDPEKKIWDQRIQHGIPISSDLYEILGV